MLSLKEGTDNRMLVLENMMREIGGDKMKALISDVSSLQHDSIALWKENARMILEIEQRAHVDQVVCRPSFLNVSSLWQDSIVSRRKNK